jgi:hypothetical protein
VIVYGEELRPWLEKSLGEKVPHETEFLGFVLGGEPYAVVGFHSYYGDDVELCASAVCGTPAFLLAVFDYVFVQLKCRRCTAKVRADNKRSLKLVKRLGFKQEGIMRKARNGCDVIVFGLLKEECKHGWRTKGTNAGRSKRDHQRAVAGQPRQQDNSVRFSGVHPERARDAA